MNISELFKALGVFREDNKESQEVTAITADTRRVTQGSIFFLLSRAESQRDKYIKDAKRKGALFVFHGNESFREQDVYIPNIEESFSKALQELYKRSFLNLNIYGVTGTNGKTTTSFMLKVLLESYGVPTGIFGTVENSFQNNFLNINLTSPTAEDFYRFNDENYQKGMRAVVCEVSSHALDQKRLGVNFLSGAGFTSFSQDHLDYHKSMEEYLKAKLKIVDESLKKNGFFIAHSQLKKDLSLPDGKRNEYIGEGDFNIKVRDLGDQGVEVEFSKGDKTIRGSLGLPGIYNGENFGLALTFLCHHFGKGFFPDQRVFNEFKFIPGRMEKIIVSENSRCFIDYSHTPDALEKALLSLKSRKQLIVVFGCGGERDKLKRPLMAKVACEIADQIIITNDNPRKEDPKEIIEDILSGIKNKESVSVVQDRFKAIERAVGLASKEPSVILIAGKGHEITQEINGEKTFFSDKEVVLKIIQEKGLL